MMSYVAVLFKISYYLALGGNGTSGVSKMKAVHRLAFFLTITRIKMKTLHNFS